TPPGKPVSKPKPAGGFPQKPKPPVVGTEDVLALCGHPVKFELYADRADPFRKERRANVGKRACPECRAKAHAELLANQPRNPERLGHNKLHSRLPDGSS